MTKGYLVVSDKDVDDEDDDSYNDEVDVNCMKLCVYDTMINDE